MELYVMKSCSKCKQKEATIEFKQNSDGTGEEYELCNYCRTTPERKKAKEDMIKAEREKKDMEIAVEEQTRMFKVYKTLGHFNNDPPTERKQTQRERKFIREQNKKQPYVPKKREYKKKSEVKKNAKQKTEKRKKRKKETKLQLYNRLKGLLTGGDDDDIYETMYNDCYHKMTPKDLLQCIHIFVEKKNMENIRHCAKSGILLTYKSGDMQEMKKFYYYRLFAADNIKDMKNVLNNMLEVFTGVHAFDNESIMSAITLTEQGVTTEEVMQYIDQYIYKN